MQRVTYRAGLCWAVMLAVILPATGQKSVTMPPDVRRVLDRPVASCKYDHVEKLNLGTLSSSNQRAVLWEYVLTPKNPRHALHSTLSVVILTCGFDSNPIEHHRVAWVMYTSKRDDYTSCQDATWDIFYHPETTKLYVVRLLSRPMEKKCTVDVYAADPSARVDLAAGGLELPAADGNHAPITHTPLTTLEVDIPAVKGTSQSRGQATNPKLSARGNVLWVSFSRADESQPIIHSFDLTTKTWDQVGK